MSETVFGAPGRPNPAGGVAGEHEGPGGPEAADRQGSSVAGPGRVAGPADPEIGIDARVSGVGRRTRPEAAPRRVAPDVDRPPLVRPVVLAVVQRPAAVHGGRDDERLAAHPARDGQAVADVPARPVV